MKSFKIILIAIIVIASIAGCNKDEENNIVVPENNVTLWIYPDKLDGKLSY